MTTSGDALAAGSLDYVLVVATEGLPFLLTTSPFPAAVVTAWAGTDWTRALGGLYVELANEQRFDPWEPFQGGGTLTLRVVPDPTATTPDELGIAIAKTAALPYTEITATIDRDDNTFHVKRADDFNAAPSEAFIGNECFAYSSKTSTTFSVSQRGKYSPFGNGNADPAHWAGDHRISTFNSYTSAVPVVAQFRQSFKGAGVGIWLHRVVGGVLDTKAQAQCIFAGRIDETVDDSSGTTIIHCKHILDVIRETTLGADQYRAKVGPGIYLTAGTTFNAWDQTLGNAALTAFPITVVSSGAVAPNQINEGHYTALAIADFLNAWCDSERAAGRLYAYHAFMLEQRTTSSGQARPFFDSTHRSSVALASGFLWSFWALSTGPDIGAFLGRGTTGTLAYLTQNPGSGPGSTTITDTITGREPVQGNQFAGLGGLNPNQRFTISEAVGTYFDQGFCFPPGYEFAYAGGARALFLVNNKTLIAGTVSGSELIHVYRGQSWFNAMPAFDTDTDTVEIVQVYALSGPMLNVISWLFMSSGTANYNDATFDVLPSSLGMGLPGALMPANFDATLAALPGQGIVESVWIVKPTKLVDLLSADMVMRGAHLVFRNGGLEWSVWSTPLASGSTPEAIVLDEGTKAEPSGHQISQRSVSLMSALWAKPIVNIQYDWSPVDNTFAGSISLIDPVAIDAQGGPSDPQKIQLRNIGTGEAAINALHELLGGAASGDVGFYAKWIPWASQPLRIITRSIAPTKYEGVCPGDVALVSDNHVRDPSTGLRKITSLPGLLLRHSSNLGGWTGPNMTRPEPPAGEVDIMLPARNNATIWSPAADLDETVSTGGFTAGYNPTTHQLTCKAHSYSEASEAADASSWLLGFTILVTERDPDVVGSPLQWQVGVLSVVGNVITLGTALPAPAFDTGKRYVITSADWTAVSGGDPLQFDDAYMASSSTGIVEGDRNAYEWGLAGINTITPSPPVHTDPCEHVPATAYGDGAALDTANHRALARTIDNLMNHRTAHQSPALGVTVMKNTKSGLTGSFQLVYMAKKFFGVGKYGVGAPTRRSAWASLFLRRDKAGTATARVTLARSPMTAPYLVSATATVAGYAWGGAYSQFTTTTAGGTTWVTTAEQALDLAVLDADGCAWLCIELDAGAECRGIAQCIERERT